MKIYKFKKEMIGYFAIIMKDIWFKVYSRSGLTNRKAIIREIRNNIDYIK